MELAHIAFEHLSVSATNMRQGKRAPDIADILPSIRVRGVLVPLLVRPTDDADHFEIVAGRRRYFGAKAVREERGEIDPLPCAIMAPGDDAAALEASLIENLARLDPDPMRQYETFVGLVREGRGLGEIATTFGLTETQVMQRLALGNLLPKIREAYRAEGIDPETVRYLTLATKAQQKAWLALFADEKQYAPTGAELKRWLFGGRSISTKIALFPLADYPGDIVTDLFGDEGYFVDSGLFWAHQDAAIEAKRQAYRDAGWKTVEVMVRGEAFHSWDHEKVQKKRGGKVFIAASHHGEVQCFEGYLSRKEAAKQRGGKETAAEPSPAKAQRAEVTSNLQAYIDLHRHAAVRHILADYGAIASRLLLAHLIAGSGPWQRSLERPLHQDDGINASLAASPRDRAFQKVRAETAILLGEPEEAGTLLKRHGDPYETAAVFQRLLSLSEDGVLRVTGMVMAEALLPGTPMVEMLGTLFKIDMAASWKPDEVFFDLVRDREVLNAMLAEIAGPATAAMHVSDTAKRQKEIIRNYLSGANGRPKVENWLPRWMAFPAAQYTERGGLHAVEHQNRLTELASQEAAESDNNFLAKA
ncbi:MAG TPA: ParB N-terminal domain-containing protein [Terriglobales bacterium]|nr:ParB N-terminal domain-containing protein [Terriglobales bacterium]